MNSNESFLSRQLLLLLVLVLVLLLLLLQPNSGTSRLVFTASISHNWAHTTGRTLLK